MNHDSESGATTIYVDDPYGCVTELQYTIEPSRKVRHERHTKKGTRLVRDEEGDERSRDDRPARSLSGRYSGLAPRASRCRTLRGSDQAGDAP